MIDARQRLAQFDSSQFAGAGRLAQSYRGRGESAGVTSTRRPSPQHTGVGPDARIHHSYHVGAHGVTGGGKGAGNLPLFPRVILEPKPGVSEAEYRQDVDRIQALLARRHALADELAKLRTGTGPSYIIEFMTVLALVKCLEPDIPPACLGLLTALLPPPAVRDHGHIMRGSIAAGVAVLRSAKMGIPQIERWLGEEIKRRALDFTAPDAIRWFYDCSNNAKVASAALQMFRAWRPEPSLSLTKAVAKKQMAIILDRAAVMKAGPLRRPRRRG